MSNLEEQNEGRKDARVDRANKKGKRQNLNVYAQPYQDGYNEEWENTKPPSQPKK